MPVQSFWDNEEKTIIRYVCERGWTWEEFFAAKKHANQLMDTVPNKLGVIVESSSTSGLPRNLLEQTRKAVRSKHPNTVIVVLIVTNPFLRTMANTLRAISPQMGHYFVLASTLDEARALCNVRLAETA